jgi:Tol biopolymer transport system component
MMVYMTKTTSHIVIGTTLMLAIAVAAWQLFDDRIVALWQPATPSEVAVETPSNLLGSFLMTMQPMKPDAPAALYRMLAGTGEAKVEYDKGSFYAPALSNDGTKVALVSQDGEDDALLFVSLVSDPSKAQVYAPPSPALRAGASDWSSDDSHITYAAVTALPSDTDYSMDYSRVVVLNPGTGEQSIVDTGGSPIFAPDGSLLYLKADGVYRTKLDGFLATGTSERFIYFEDYDANRNSQIALSPDGNTLVVTHPDAWIFLAYSVVGTKETVSVVPIMSKIQRSTWPVFSPDSARLGFVNITKTDEGIVRKSLDMIELLSGTQTTVTSLDAYEDVNLSIGAWLPLI